MLSGSRRRVQVLSAGTKGGEGEKKGKEGKKMYEKSGKGGKKNHDKPGRVAGGISKKSKKRA